MHPKHTHTIFYIIKNKINKIERVYPILKDMKKAYHGRSTRVHRQIGGICLYYVSQQHACVLSAFCFAFIAIMFAIIFLEMDKFYNLHVK